MVSAVNVCMSESPITHPRQLRKMSSSGCSWASMLMRLMTPYGIETIFQVQRVMTLPVARERNLCPPWEFLLGPRDIAPCVHAAMLFHGATYSWTWQ